MVFRASTVLIGIALACLSSAQVLFTDNFDTYTAGSLLNSHSPWDSTGSPNYTISTDEALSGTKSAKVVGQGVTGSTDFAWINLNGGNDFTFSASQAQLTGSVSVWLNGGLQPTDWVGVAVFDSSVDRLAGIRFNGAGALQFWNGAGWVANTQIVAPTNEWVSLKIDAISSSATSGYFRYSVNDLRFDQYQLNYASGFAVSDFDLYQFGNATGYFDNYQVKAVPEPATLATLGLALAAFRRRKRN